jgi:oligopeptide transport system substrate-binding protein
MLYPKSFLLSLYIVVLVFLSGCGRHESQVDVARKNKVLLLGNVAEPADLDPHAIFAWTDSNITYSLFEGLTSIDEANTQPVPAAAKSWDVTSDGLVYVFHLRSEGKWSNGDPVTAGDFVFSFKRILTPALAASYSYMLWPIKNAEAYNTGKIKDFSEVGVKALDPLTLQITLEKPTSYLPSLASHTTWLPVNKKCIEAYGKFDQKGTAWTRPGRLIGNGPFNLKEWIPNGKIVVEKSITYWDSKNVFLNGIEFFPIENTETEEAAFRAGQLQVTYSLPISKVKPYQKNHPELLRIDPRFASYYLFINVTKAPFDNPKLRKALALAVNRDSIAHDVLNNTRVPAHAFTPPDCAGYTTLARIDDDIAKAKQLLVEAGYPGGKGLPTFEVQSYNNDSSIKTLEAIQALWARELGVHITIAPLEQKILFQNQQSQNYTLAFSAWIADYADPSTFLNMMITGGGNNWAGWSNKKFDSLIEAASRSPDQNVRYGFFQNAERILLEDAPLIPLYYGQQPYLKQPWVMGWPPSQLGFERFKNVSFEP